MRKIALSVGIALQMTACAGRTPQPVSIVKVTNHNFTHLQTSDEIAINKSAISGLREVEEDIKAHDILNGAAAGFVSWLFVFALDFKDAAGEERKTLQSRNNRLHEVRGRHCANDPNSYDAIAQNQSQVLLLRRR
jgi:hypothetical protein